MMTPPSRVHQEISGALFAQLYNFLEGKSAGYMRRPSPSACSSGIVIPRKMLIRWLNLIFPLCATVISWTNTAVRVRQIW